MSSRRITIALCAAAGLLVWFIVPGTSFDRAFFSLTAKSFLKSDYFVTGKGSHKNPLTLHTLRSTPPDFTATLPPDIVIADDPERVFQSSPPSPVDFAVILKNLRRMGRQSVAIGTPLSWSETDAISLTALDQQLDAFPSVITSAPLSRNPVPTPIPPAFRRASIPLYAIDGDVSLLPIVNRIPIPDVVLGNKTSLAGFTTLESEESTALPHLLARWDDRAVLSFHLLAALDRFHVPPHAITVRLGEWISLGTDGPYIPIDRFGRLSTKVPFLTAASPIPAETLIDAPDDFLAKMPADPALIRNGLSAADPIAANYSESLLATIAVLSHPEGNSETHRFPRPPWYAELLLLAAILSLLYGFGNYPSLRGKRPLAILAGIILIDHFILVPLTSTWIPTLPTIACILTAIAFATHPVPPKQADPEKKPSPKAPARKSPKKKSPRKRKPR